MRHLRNRARYADPMHAPEGFYTFPSDAFMRDEILRARQIGLNGQRIHVKVGIPRKLYWADRLGMLIMADLPNSWGEPDDDMRSEVAYTLQEMIKRDYNHPSIFAWVPFNETWGLYTELEVDGEKEHKYLPETQEWVVSIYEWAKRMDPTRLVEDNSCCCGLGHTRTDINSWHAYLPGWEWESALDEISDSTFEGSGWNFEEGYTQGRQPNINSEFGNVWGYEGSTARILRIDPAAFSDAGWSLKQWTVLDGLKINGAGAGFFEYRFRWPEDLSPVNLESATFVMEASAKQLFGKDRDGGNAIAGDFMRGLGTLDPSLNPNAYPMTDETTFPSGVTVRVQDEVAGVFELPDDTADHRGILSWHAQLKDGWLREAGSYGYLLSVNVPHEALEKAAAAGEAVVRLEVSESLPGGLAIYGARFGRYPVDPTLVLVERK